MQGSRVDKTPAPVPCPAVPPPGPLAPAMPGLLAPSRSTIGRHVSGRGVSWPQVRALLALVVVLTVGVQHVRYSLDKLVMLSVDNELDAMDTLGISGGSGPDWSVGSGGSGVSGGGGAVQRARVGATPKDLVSQFAGDREATGVRPAGGGVPSVVTARARTDVSATGGGEGEGEEEEGAVEEDEGRDDGGEAPAKPKCRCTNGFAENCRSLARGHEPNPRELAIAAVCEIAREVASARVRRAQRVRDDAQQASWRPGSGGTVGREDQDPQLKAREAKRKPWFVRKDAGDVMRTGGGTGDRWLREFYTAEEREHAAVVNALEMRAAAAIMRAVPRLVRPVGRDLMPENIFYSVQNHEKLRDRKDPFRNDSLHLLPRTSPTLRYSTCAVVGSSGVMTASGFGQQIDAHDAVVRLNQAPCQARYQPDVGARTTLRILNKRWTAIYGRHHPELMHVDPDGRKESPDQEGAEGGAGGRVGRMTVVASRCNTAEYKKLGQSAANLDPPVSSLFLATRIASHAGELLSVFRRGMTEAMGRRFRGGTSPSSGFLAVFIMLQMCGLDGGGRGGVGTDGAWRAANIGVYGFSADECRTGGCVNSYHYFTGFIDSPWLRAHPSHSFELEGIALQALSTVGELCYVTNSTGACAGRGPEGHPTSEEGKVHEESVERG